MGVLIFFYTGKKMHFQKYPDMCGCGLFAIGFTALFDRESSVSIKTLTKKFTLNNQDAFRFMIKYL